MRARFRFGIMSLMPILQVGDKIAAALDQRARERGLSVEALLDAWIAERSDDSGTAVGGGGEEAAREFDAVLDELFASDSSPPPAPCAPASSRDDIYFDHD